MGSGAHDAVVRMCTRTLDKALNSAVAKEVVESDAPGTLHCLSTRDCILATEEKGKGRGG